jgi:hypothetical protein
MSYLLAMYVKWAVSVFDLLIQDHLRGFLTYLS